MAKWGKGQPGEVAVYGTYPTAVCRKFSLADFTPESIPSAIQDFYF